MYQPIDLTSHIDEYLLDVASVTAALDRGAVNRVANELLACKKRGGVVYTAGNGGSAATASHMVNDLTKGCRVHGREGFKSICLNDSSTLVTCLANDFSYEEAYTVQLKTLGRKGDCLVVFSGSGNSPNVVHAAAYARTAGIRVLGFLGRDGGKLLPLCDEYILAPTCCMEKLEDIHMICEHTLATVMRDALSDQWGMEVIFTPGQNRRFKSALFDFDGTISLIREGWQQIMIPYFVEVLAATPGAKGETESQLTDVVTEFVFRLTGKQTIYQCIELAEQVKARGGTPDEPMAYKDEYLRRLMVKIHDRREGLRSGKIDPRELMVKGSIELFEQLKAAGISLYLASGTDEPMVIEEAKLLQIDRYFDGQIYGARDEHATDCTKELVIKGILKDNNLTGDQLLSFGDGFVEIELVAGIGGYAVALATDEQRKMGIDEWKRRRLIKAGAGAVIPDFEDARAIVDFVLDR